MKSYRMLRVCSAGMYTRLFADFYEANRLDQVSYDDALQAYRENGYLTPGGWSECMRELGNESTEVVPDFSLLQKKWVQERGIKVDFTGQDWSVPTLMAQIDEYRPDVILFCWGAFHTVPSGVRRQLKTHYPFLKIVTGLWTDIPPRGDYSIFDALDMVFAADRYFADELSSVGLETHLMYSCFDNVFCQLDGFDENGRNTQDLVFAGSSGYGYENHQQRYFDLVELMQNTNLLVWSWERKLKWPPSFRRRTKNIVVRLLSKMNPAVALEIKNRLARSGRQSRLSRLIDEAMENRAVQEPIWKAPWWSHRRPLSEIFPDRCFPPVFGLEYYRLLKRAKVVFNTHIDDARHYGNFRMFEATGVGSCLLTDRGEESAELFVPDQEIVTYSSIDECIEKVAYLLDHETVRREIALRGQRRTLRDHTVMQRCRQIDEILQKAL